MRGGQYPGNEGHNLTVRDRLDVGVTRPILHITGFDQQWQFERVTQEVLPLLK